MFQCTFYLKKGEKGEGADSWVLKAYLVRHFPSQNCSRVPDVCNVNRRPRHENGNGCGPSHVALLSHFPKNLPRDRVKRALIGGGGDIGQRLVRRTELLVPPRRAQLQHLSRQIVFRLLRHYIPTTNLSVPIENPHEYLIRIVLKLLYYCDLVLADVSRLVGVVPLLAYVSIFQQKVVHLHLLRPLNRPGIQIHRGIHIGTPLDDLRYKRVVQFGNHGGRGPAQPITEAA
eukprot:173004-Prorocentrum_minimum.AAC.1